VARLCPRTLLHPPEVSLRLRSRSARLFAIVTLLLLGARSADAQPFAYVLAERQGDNASLVTVINTVTNAKVATIPLGAICNCLNPHGVAASPDGARVYASSTSSGVVSVIDTATNSLITNWAVGPRPTGIVVSPDSSRVFVISSAAVASQTAVRVVQATTGAVIGNIPLGVANATGIAITPDGSRLYVTTLTGMAGNDTVKVINTLSNSVIASIPVGNLAPGVNTPSFPIGVDVSPDGATAYVAVRHSGVNNGISFGAVAVISTASNSVLQYINVNVNPHPVRVSPDNSSIYVAHNGNPFTTAIISRASHSVVGAIPGTQHANSLAFTPDGTRAFVANSDATVVSLNTTTRTIAASIPFNPVSEGVPEAVAIASPPAVLPAPTGLSVVSVLGNSVTLQWSPASTGPVPSHFIVEGGIAPGEVLGRVTTPGNVSTFTFVAPSGAFFVRVHAALGGSRSAASNEVPLLVNLGAACGSPPPAPVNLQVSRSGNLVTASWGKGSGESPATGYVLSVSGSFTGSFTTASLSLSGTAGPGTYNLSVAATNACGASGGTSIVSVTIP
jgi:YVTN family beta-propeller protein